MKLNKAIEKLSDVVARQPQKDWKLLVKVFNPGATGGTPCVPVSRIDVGMDWDNGKVILTSDFPLTLLSLNEVADIRKSSREGQSWHALQNYKRQDERIKELEAEIAVLKTSKVNSNLFNS